MHEVKWLRAQPLPILQHHHFFFLSFRHSHSEGCRLVKLNYGQERHKETSPEGLSRGKRS